MKNTVSSSERIHQLILLVFGIMAIFVLRLFWLQIIDHSKYEAMAAAEHIKTLTIPAARGEIYAMDNGSPVPLVLNQQVYNVIADPQQVPGDQQTAIISMIKSIAGNRIMGNAADQLKIPGSQYALLAQGVTYSQAQKMKAKGFTGIGFQQATERVYPEGDLASQVLGFVNQSGQGQYGIEQGMNSQLAGKNGMLKSVTDVSNVPLTIGNKNVSVAPKNGTNVVLTIDRNVQAYAQQALAEGAKNTGAVTGSAIVMDPQTGKVLAMANLPTYSPGDYNHVTNPAAFDNATISVPYEPGSVMKTFTAAMAIDQGVIQPDSTYDNTDHINVDGAVISNATLGQTGTITFQHAMNYSLNTGYVTVAERLGGTNDPPGFAHINQKARNIMYDYLHGKFRLGQLTGIPLAGEQAGIVISPNQAQGNSVRYSNMAFGQGMDITMLQVAAGFSAIINGGTYYKPSIVAGSINNEGNYVANSQTAGVRILSANTSKETAQMAHVARDSLFETDDKPGYYIGGKTGTSQLVVNGSYSNTATTASYLGFGGGTKPRYVIMVQVSTGDRAGLSGGTAAMPIFTNISNWLLSYLRVHPIGK